MGPAGLTVVIVREDLIGEPMEKTPTMFTYKTHAENDFVQYTSCYSIYMCMLVLEWLKNDIGGLAKMKELNEKKFFKTFYDFLDQSQLIKGTVVPKDRSLMNVPFVTGNDELDAKFIKEAGEHDFVNIKGHRSVGGSVLPFTMHNRCEKLVALRKSLNSTNNE